MIKKISKCNSIYSSLKEKPEHFGVTLPSFTNKQNGRHSHKINSRCQETENWMPNTKWKIINQYC